MVDDQPTQSPSESEPKNPISPDDAMPTVSPPTSGFILQLFIIPGAIVTIIIAVWLGMNLLTGDTADPRELLAQIDKGQWQAAVRLAKMLNDPQQEELRGDSEFAQSLATRLTNLSERSSKATEEEIKMRMYLARALGLFHVSDGLPALLLSAKLQKTDAEKEVRRYAIDSIGLLANSVRSSLVERLEDTSTLAEDLAADIDERSDHAELAARFSKLSEDAAMLAKNALKTDDLAHQSESIADRTEVLLTDLSKLEPNKNWERTTELRESSDAMKQQAKHVFAIDMQSNAEMAKVMAAAAETFDVDGGETTDADRLRSHTAYALGLIGGKKSTDILAVLANDSYVNASYNAATGLARRGIVRINGEVDVQAIVIEMIHDPTVIDLAESMKEDRGEEQWEKIKEQNNLVDRQHRKLTGLDTAVILAENNSDDRLARLVDVVRQLANDEDVDRSLRYKAKVVLEKLENRNASLKFE